MSEPTMEFGRTLLGMGIVSYSEQDTLWSIASKCAKTTGMPMGAGVGLVTMKAGAVTVPGVGAIPGAVAGFLAGLFAGTALCTAANLSHRNELRKLLD